MSNSKPYLLIGPRKGNSNNTKVGGIVVLFEDLIGWSDKKHIPTVIIDTNKSNYSSKLVALIQIYWRIIVKTPKCQSISLHGTANDYKFIAPFAIVFAHLFNKKIALRKFAGNFDVIYDSATGITKKIYSFVLKKTDYLFFETKNLVEFGKCHNSNVHWFPNVRRVPELFSPVYRNSFNGKFLFLSQISIEKGILDLLKVFWDFNGKYTLDIYGPLIDVNESQLAVNGVHYKGTLEHKEVYKVLSNYDCLILPSYREGYPGIIIEAFATATPVIASSVGGIPEMITNDLQGRLFNAKNIVELRECIDSIDKEKLEKYSKNSRISFQNYNSDIVYERLKHLIFPN